MSTRSTHAAAVRLRTVVLLVVVLAMSVGALAPSAADASSSATLAACQARLPQLRADGVEMINQQRAAAGVDALIVDDGLAAVAQDWSETMARTGVYEHRPAFASAYPSGFGGGGENIHRVPDSPTAAAYVNHGFVHSPGHLQNMVRPWFTHVGLGYACTSGGQLYATQNYGAMRDGASSVPAPLPKTLSVACPTTLATPNPYQDVLPGGHGQSVLCLTAWEVFTPRSFQLTSTYRTTEWHPEDVATRADFAEALYRVLDVGSDHAPARPSAPVFGDVPAGHEHAVAIESLAAAGIINGVTDTSFAPDAPVSRGQMASLLTATHEQIFGGSWTSGEGFPDTVGTTHETNIRKLVGAGITVGFPDGTYRPDVSMTRGQMATFQARYAQLLVAEDLARVPA